MQLNRLCSDLDVVFYCKDKRKFVLHLPNDYFVDKFIVSVHLLLLFSILIK